MYDAYTQAQINADNQRREYLEKVINGKERFTMDDLYQTFEQENIEHINDLHREIGLMKSLIERFPDDKEIKQFSEYFIRIGLVEMEKLAKEVLYDRETTKEFSRVQR